MRGLTHNFPARSEHSNEAYMEFYNTLFDQPSELPVQWMQHDFEQCTFKNLNLPGVAFTKSNFINCRFEHCNLTQTTLGNTKLDDITFVNCQLMHVDFGLCNPFGLRMDFQQCRLDYAVFLDRKLKKTQFIECSMKEVHFLKCDLTNALFDSCDLELAKFGENNLTGVDFSSSYNFRIDPDDNIIKKARFSRQNLLGLLAKYDIKVVE